MTTSQYNKELFSYLKASPSAFHSATTLAQTLKQNGFSELYENEDWNLEKGKSYFILREMSALIAFTIGDQEELTDGFRLIAAHTDSPCLQIKPRPEITSGTYQQLGVEVYGGCLLAPWFDRDLSLAGRICYKNENGDLNLILIDFQRPILTIPSVAIHLNREANSGATINKQSHLVPILALTPDKEKLSIEEALMTELKKQYPDVRPLSVLSYDLFCYEQQGPVLTGLNNEFISSPRLDNLLSCHAGMKAIIDTGKSRNSLLYCANHEENGSLSTTGAQGSFLSTVFERIMPDSSKHKISMSNSFLISADNAHATHPNYLDRMDKNHEIHLNHGPVIKINANQRYTSNSITSALFKEICATVDVHPQEFVMRSDMACGSTIGPMTSAQLGVRAVDVGAPTLAMHSIREFTGASDPFLLYKSLQGFLQSDTHRSLK